VLDTICTSFVLAHIPFFSRYFLILAIAEGAV